MGLSKQLTELDGRASESGSGGPRKNWATFWSVRVRGTEALLLLLWRGLENCEIFASSQYQ